MNKLKQAKHLAVGQCRVVFSSLLLILAFTNLTNIITNKVPFVVILYMVVPFIITAIIMLFISNNKAISIICLMAALYSTLNQNVIGDYSASIFFIFSFHVSKNKIYGTIVIAITTLCVFINSIMVGGEITITLNLLIAYTAIYIIYYFFIFKPIENKYNINYATRSEEEKAILKLYGKGCSYSEISKALGMNVTDVTIRRRIKAVRDESGAKNDVQFGQWLFGNA